MTFNSAAFNNVTLTGPSGSTLTLTGSAPSINVGVSGHTATGLIASINENVSTTSATAPLLVTNYGTGTNGTPPWSQQLNLGGTSSTINIASGALTIANPTSAGFAVNAPSFSLQTLTFAPNGTGATDIGPVGGYSSGAPTSTLTFTSPSGVSPEIIAGGGSKSTSHIYQTVVVTPNATNSPLIIDNLDATSLRSAVSFGYAVGGEIPSTVSNNSFPTGIELEATSGGVSYDTTLAAAAGTTRLNFNLPGASGTGAGAGPIYVDANGAIISDEGSQNAFTLNMTNQIVLNHANITPTNGDFIAAIGGTKPSNGSTVVIFSGVISGNGDVLIGNDLVEGSGGAGLTEFNNTMQYTGKTIINGSIKGVLQMELANSLPSTTALVFGHSSPHDTTPLANSVAALDLNGYSQTITSLSSDVNPSSVLAGVTNSSTSATTPFLTITGSTVDWYTGGIGVAAAGSGFGAGLNAPASNNNLGLTRAGSGTTILGSTGSNLAPINPSTYAGDTIVGDAANAGGVNATSTLEAASTASFSPNSNYTVYGTLDLGNYSNTINSLASVSTTGATGTVTTSAGATISFGLMPGDDIATNPNNPSGGATLTIGSLTTANSSTQPVTTFYGVLADGAGGQLSLVKAGLGTQVLAGVNTYTGTTTVTGGTLSGAPLGTLSLASTGSLSASSAVTVMSHGTLAGFGDAQGPVSIQSTGTIAPGSSTQVGGLSVGSLTLYGGSSYTWKLGNAAGTNAGADYDTITSSGALTLDSSVSPSNPVTINLTPLNLTGLSTDSASPQSWTLVTAGSFGGTFSPSDFNVIASIGNFFSTFVVSNPASGNLVLTYTPGTTPAILSWVGPGGSGGGTGNWDPSAGTNWNNGSSNGPWNSANSADFNAGSGTVTLTGAVSTPLIVFEVDGYTIAGSDALTATTGYRSLAVQVTNSGTTATIDAPINSPLTKIGAGTLVLGSTSSTFGATSSATVSAGTLQGTTATLTASNISNNSILVFDQSTSGGYAGTISGGGQVVIQNSAGTGSPVVKLTGTNNTYDGGTTISSNATLSVADPGNIGGASAGLTLNGGTLQISTGTGVTFGGALAVTAAGGTITDAGGVNSFSAGASLASGAVLTKNGPGTLQIAQNAYTGSGSIVIAAGSLQVGNEITGNNTNPSTFLGNNSLTLGSLGSSATTTLTIAAGSDSVPASRRPI